MSHILPDSTKLRPSTKGTAYGDELEGEIDSLIEKTSYTYDGFNRLNNTETIKAGERTTAEYTYDGDDLRVSKTVRKSGSGYRAEVTNYLYDRQNVILETDAEGNTRASYVKGINYISKTDGTGADSYYLFNGHGDVVQTVDAAGNTQNQYEYDIWGNPVLTIETAAGNAIRYAGEFLDSETGLYYLRARFYDPYIGRFTTEDSYWGEDENPLSLNLYTYCANDPVRYVDPSGHVWMYNAGGRLQDIDQKDVSGATQVGYSLAKDVTMYNSGGFSSQVAVSDISRAEQVGFVLPQLIYNSTDTVNVSSGVVINYSNIQNMNIAANAHVFVENRGFIDTLFSDKGSSMTLDNYGKVRAVNIGEGAVANIFNYNQERDPETNEYIKSIEVITGGLKSNINLFNYGGVGEVHTGDYSENLVYNENEEAYVNWLETGLGNSSATDQGTRYYSGRGSIKVISDLDKLKANLYKLGYINVYKDYASARNQFLKDYLDNGHSLDADFKRMGSGDHYSSLLNWTNKALAGKYTHTTDGRNKGNANDFVNGFIEHFTDKVDAAKKYYSELFSNPLEKTIEVYTDPRTIAKLNPSTDMLLQAYDMGIIAYSDYKLLLSGDKQALLKRAGDASGELLEIIALSLVLKKFGTFEEKPKSNPVGGGCFTAGTLVPTEDGQRPIEEVKVGDYVWSENPETGKKGLKKVVDTFIHDKYTLIHVYTGDTMIDTTEEHPFWVEEKGWVFAGQLNEGDVLRLKTGENVKVTKLERIDLKEPVKVYNFEVQDWHTYYVSDVNVLVHNKAMIKQPTNINMVKDGYLKKNGIDAHKLKAEALGTKNDIAKYDIYKDKDTGQLWVYRKGGKGEGIPTGEYID